MNTDIAGLESIFAPVLLAQDAPAATPEAAARGLPEIFDFVVGHLNILTQPEELMRMLTGISPVWAGIFIVLGWMSITCGYKWHKTILVVCAVLLGIGAGLLLGDYLGSSIVLATCLGALFAVLAAPFLDYTVAFFGALIGAYIGANLWSSVSPGSELYWSGALIGATSMGILAFILFRFVVILFTAVGGASLLAFGVLTVMLQVDVWHDGLVTSLEGNPLLLPIIVGVCSAISFILQQGGGVVAVVTAKAPERTKKKPAAA